MNTAGECLTGGHYLEVLRLGKQMKNKSYMALHRSMMRQSDNIFFHAFYRGFMPWGLLQCAKGIPVLFVQTESMYQLQKIAKLDHNTAEKSSGFLGGAAQAIFVTPMRKLKLCL